jgi:LuxR family glucitol operon transcriptional activator
MIPGELIDQFSRGNGSIFVGAGVSVGAGLPNWASLVKSLADDIEDCPDCSFLDIAQYYAIVRSRMTLVEHLRRALVTPRDFSTETYEALLDLQIRHFFTTNFDELLEEAFRRQGFDPNVIAHNEHVSFWDESKVQVIKLHGDLRDPDSIVITAEDYEDYFHSHSALADLVKAELQTRTVLFLGYSFNDIDLRMILARVSRESRKFRRNLFTIQFDPPELAVRDLERRGMKVIVLHPEEGPGGYNRALQTWLREFAQRLDQSRQAAVTEAQPEGPAVVGRLTNHNLPPHSEEDLLGRKADFARVMEGLRSRYPLITIEGFAGIGKTSLAIEVGYACASNRKEGVPEVVAFEYVVWITTKDKPDQRYWLDDVLNVIARTTGFSALTQRPSGEWKAGVDRLLRMYKILLIIDNFETVDDPDLMTWLEQLPEPSKVIITTRRAQFLQKAWPVRLKGMEVAEAFSLLRQHAAHIKLDFFPEVNDETLLELWKVTGGNPQAMKLALGLVHGGALRLWQLIDQIRESRADRRTDRLFRDLFERSWQRLPEPARQILLMTPLFVGVSSIREDALQAVTGLPDDDFLGGLEQCRDSSLLELDYSDSSQQRYVIHPMTRAFVRKELDDRKDLEAAGRQRCGDYFLKFVRERVKRERPEPRYWNALVSDGMEAIDLEWPSIQEVMKWADQEGQDERLVDLVMLLVHYMDSRFLNRERLSYVHKAIAALERLNRKEDEALLRIDALGWTYVEENRLEEAYAEIHAGFKLAEKFAAQERNDLLALGLAWRARVRIEQELPELAQERIDEALTIDCQPWIRCRVNMAAGDIALKLGDSAKALTYYESAESEAQKYGGEGRGYQTLPRIGLAYLAMGRLDDAEQKFRELFDVKRIAIGNLYAEYGLAMAAYKRGDVVNARELIEDVKSKLSRTAPNLLLKLIKSQEAQLPDLAGST